MKTSPFCSSRTLLALVCLVAVAPLRAADVVKYVGRPGSKVTMDGTSNIHDWTVTGQIISGFMEVSPAFDKDLKTLAPVPKVEVTIPVRTLKSGKDKMDEVMQEHMRIKENPAIKYRVTEMTLKSEPKTPNGPAEYTSKGELTVAGTTKTIEMPVTIERVDASKIKVKGVIPLKMTEFKITPPAPTLAFGLIKTGDDVKIAFEWVLAKAVQAAAAQ